MEEKFTKEVAEKLKFYVYRLIDPSSGATFYVGKGKGNRVFQHAKGERVGEPDKEDRSDLKMKTIETIRRKGLEVNYVIHRHGIEDEAVAYEVEAALMDAYPGLTNAIGGHGSSDYGVAHPKEIIATYAAQAFVAREPLILINVSQTSDDKERSIYDATRGVWKINPDRASRTKLVLAHKHGLVVGVFRPKGDWLPATRDNFPWLAEDVPKRFGFVGEEAEDATRNQYVNKRVPDEFRKKGSANPIRFVET